MITCAFKSQTKSLFLAPFNRRQGTIRRTGSYPRIGLPSGMKYVVFTYFHGLTKIRFNFVFYTFQSLIGNKNLR